MVNQTSKNSENKGSGDDGHRVESKIQYFNLDQNDMDTTRLPAGKLSTIDPGVREKLMSALSDIKDWNTNNVRQYTLHGGDLMLGLGTRTMVAPGSEVKVRTMLGGPRDKEACMQVMNLVHQAIVESSTEKRVPMDISADLPCLQIGTTSLRIRNEWKGCRDLLRGYGTVSTLQPRRR